MTIDIERLKVDREYWDSVAPEDAAYFDEHLKVFFCESGWWPNGEWEKYLSRAAFAVVLDTRPCIPRPEPRQVEWDGEGLPPVGWTGELKGSLDDCEIVCEWRGGRVYYNEFTEKFAWTDSGRVFSTKEQREGEELAQTIWKYGENLNIKKARKAADAIIAAGWRKAK